MLTPEQAEKVHAAEAASKTATDDRALRSWCILQAVECHKANRIDDVADLARDFYSFMTGEL